MPEEQIASTQAATDTSVDAGQNNPFSETSWVESPTPQAAPEKVAAFPTTVAAETPFDQNAYLKEKLGFDDWDSAKTQVEELRKLKDIIPAKVETKSFAEAMKEKEDDVFNYLSQKKQLDKVSKIDLLKASDAAEVLRTSLQYKYKDLSPEEINYKFNRQFAMPKKPVQTDDQTDGEYEESVSSWKEQVSEVEKEMIIEAKLVRPELAKYQSELIMPDIPLSAPQSPQPTADEIAEYEAAKVAYYKAVDKGLNDLKDFKAQYKDEEVDIPIAYEVTKEEKAAIKPILESLNTDFSYFGKRWANDDGSLNAKKMAEDIHLLENQGRIFQKFTNEAGTQRLAYKIKKDSNIQLETNPQRTFMPDNNKSEMDKMAEVMFKF